MSMQWQNVIKALESLTEFFERIGMPTSGDYFRKISAMIEQGKLEEAVDELTGLTLWGGAGSYIDKVLYPEDGYNFTMNEFGKINSEYNTLLLRLLSAVEVIAPRDWMPKLKTSLQGLVQHYSQMGDS
ncbi:MAG: hypothetical protein QXI60_05160 [Thermofilaceae archaeon]